MSKQPQIIIRDDLHPEDCAMVQAMYSRSPDTVLNHLEKVEKVGSGKFMASYYIGYGHASIGDCGDTAIFIENFSMLAAKAIQDNQLYSGQEASTRYLNFAEQPILNPTGSPAADKIQTAWLTIYNTLMPQVVAALKQQFPFNPENYKSEKGWSNAINARAFDTLRCFLPVGSTTLFSWKTNLRQARDKLMQLRTHPLPEIQDMAIDIFNALNEKYPHSYAGTEMEIDNERYQARHTYMAEHFAKDHYQTYTDIEARYNLSDLDKAKIAKGEMVIVDQGLNKSAFKQNEQAAMHARPNGAQCPGRWKAYGQANLIGIIDFGSYRDLQRHRGGICILPEINAEFGFNQWYLDQLKQLLPTEAYQNLKTQISELLNEIEEIKTQENISTTLAQYLYPMGMNVVFDLAYSIPQIVYVAELRSGKPVHGSLRPIAHQMGQYLAREFPNLKTYLDYDEDNWTAKRGEQTITEKKSA